MWSRLLKMFPVDYDTLSIAIESALLRNVGCVFVVHREVGETTPYVFECQRARSRMSDTIRNPSSEHGCSLLAARAHVCGKWKRRHKAIHPIKLPSCRDFLLHLCTGNTESSDECKCSHQMFSMYGLPVKSLSNA